MYHIQIGGLDVSEDKYNLFSWLYFIENTLYL